VNTTSAKWLVLANDFIRDDTFVIRTERHGFAFIPGQHVTLGLEGAGINREYSIYSGCNDDYLEFIVKIHPGSDSATALGALKPGAAVALAGPYGAFHLPPDFNTSTPVWFFAAGVGIAPFRSIIRSTPDIDYHIVHGVREAADAYGRHFYDPTRHLTCCSRLSDGDFHGRVTVWLQQNIIPCNALVFICGSANMVADTYECLRTQGLHSDQLLTEVFF
jgi:ferredoxin-NADP reductase